MYPTDDEEWEIIHPQDCWVYNKLILSRVLGYTCGPSGTTVPKPDFYIVRPSMNIMGMSRYARIEWIENTTNHFHPAEFWCEVFDGEHLSVDFHNKELDLVVLGHRHSENPLYKWEKWEKVDRKIEFPEILSSLTENYEWINCEMIGNRLIEVHFRRNPNFRYGNTVAIPMWDESEQEKYSDLTYIADQNHLRQGFLVDKS